MTTRRDLPRSSYLAAVTGRKPSRVPVWFMRQAGRSLPEYRALRKGHGMLAACFEPELACEITLQPIRRHHPDAAILFSDIVVPLRAAGVDLDIVPDVGPVIAHPIRTSADIDTLKPLERQAIQPVCEAVSLLVAALDVGTGLSMNRPPPKSKSSASIVRLLWLKVSKLFTEAVVT